MVSIGDRRQIFDVVLCAYSNQVLANYSNEFYRWIATSTCSHACVKCSVYQWPSSDCRRPTLRMFSTSTSVRFLSFLSFFLSSFFLSFFLFLNIQSWDTWLATFYFNRWIGDHFRICNVLFCACAMRLLHIDYHRLKSVKVFCDLWTWPLYNSDVICLVCLL